MRILARLLLAAAAATCLPALAQAKVHIAVDLDSQTMHVDAGDKSFDWKVSSGKAGHETPTGSYRVLWMDKDHHSDEYEQAYMPDAIFFAPGFAIHGFGKSPWGHAASHGCIRLPMAKAAVLFDLVKAQGAEVTITGDSAASAAAAERVRNGGATTAADRAPKGDDRGYDRGYDDARGNAYVPPPAYADDRSGGFSLFGQRY